MKDCVIHVKGTNGWLEVAGPYTRQEAENLLRVTFPLQLRRDREDGTPGFRARVVPEGTPLGVMPKVMNDWSVPS